MKPKVISISFVIFIVGFFIYALILKDEAVSKFERRKLSQVPELNNEFFQNLDDYIVDQFPLRNRFIKLNSNINRNILQIKDYNDIYIVEDTIYDINYPLNEKQCNNFSKKINYIINKDLENANVYYTIIPDKEYFLDNEKYLKIDYNTLQNNLNINAEYIDIIQKLSIADYYRTDIHWKQENLDNVAKEITEKMGKKYINIEYRYNVYESFYGASYSKAGANIKPDKLTYVTNRYIENAKVKHLEYGEKNIYDTEKATGMDMYDIFLSGPSSYIEITNPINKEGNELIIFRDSFSSSLAPLLIPYYSKITLIDLRYINYNIVSKMIEYKNKDILFIYSTNIINNSNLLKVL